jgi:hypothetical protein
MPRRLTEGVDYPRWAPSHSGQSVPLRTVEMTQAYAEWWDGNVQPIVDSLPDQTPRADRNWDWRVIQRLVRWIGGPLRQNPTQLTLGVEVGERDAFIPVAMLSVVDYSYLPSPADEATFVWFVSAAPVEAIRTLLMWPDERLPKRLTALALDIAVCISLNSRHFGRTCLHAAPEGGKRLLDWYIERGMAPLLQSIKLPQGYRRLKGNDGRYLYYTEAAAFAASSSNDLYRSSPPMQPTPSDERTLRK